MQVILVNQNGMRRLVEVPSPELAIIVQMGRLSVAYQLWSIDHNERLIYRETSSQVAVNRY